jgi:hypothetical protein
MEQKQTGGMKRSRLAFENTPGKKGIPSINIEFVNERCERYGFYSLGSNSSESVKEEKGGKKDVGFK